MLRPNASNDRLNYSNMLLPPIGYSLEYAIGTTYSLDLESLTSVAIALGLKEDLDNDLMQNPLMLLHAFQKVSNKVIIFCEDGQIKKPSVTSQLSIILEKMLVPVALPKKRYSNYYPAFHPKTWLLEYGNPEGNRIYRFIVLSRNLTFDRSWDISFSMDGDTNGHDKAKTKPIIDFLSFLRASITTEIPQANKKRQIIARLERELSNVGFSLMSREFENFTILPMGIGNKGYDIYKDELFSDSFHELVVMSPFLSGKVLSLFNECGKELTNCRKALITRKTALGNLTKSEVRDFAVYTLRDEIIDGETKISDEQEKKKTQDIHAKLYLRRKNSSVDLYLGSMNATSAATNSNVEILVKLHSKPRFLSYDKLLNDLFCVGDGNPFELTSFQYSEKITDTDEDMILEQQLKELCRIPKNAVVVKNNDRYTVEVHFSKLINDCECSLSPLCSNKTQDLSKIMVFENLELLQLSELYSIHISNGSDSLDRVIMIPTDGIPIDRDKAIVNNVISDEREFIEYIAYILEDDYLLSLLQNKQLEESGVYRDAPDLLPALYEKLLKTSLDNPQKLEEIDSVIQLIDDKTIVPDEFREMYNVFKAALKITKKNGKH